MPNSLKQAFVLNKPPEVLFDWRTTTENDTITISHYYGERIKYSYSTYYAIKYGKHYRFKIKNCKHNYKPKNISKLFENLIWRNGVLKLG